MCRIEFALRCAHTVFLSESTKAHSCTCRPHTVQVEASIEVLWTEMTKNFGFLICLLNAAASVVWELLQYLHYSLAQEQKCARTDCDEGFRQAGESSISHYLAGLVECLMEGWGLRSISAW